MIAAIRSLSLGEAYTFFSKKEDFKIVMPISKDSTALVKVNFQKENGHSPGFVVEPLNSGLSKNQQVSLRKDAPVFLPIEKYKDEDQKHAYGRYVLVHTGEECDCYDFGMVDGEQSAHTCLYGSCAMKKYIFLKRDVAFLDKVIKKSFLINDGEFPKGFKPRYLAPDMQVFTYLETKV